MIFDNIHTYMERRGEMGRAGSAGGGHSSSGGHSMGRSGGGHSISGGSSAGGGHGIGGNSSGGHRAGSGSFGGGSFGGGPMAGTPGGGFAGGSRGPGGGFGGGSRGPGGRMGNPAPPPGRGTPPPPPGRRGGGCGTQLFAVFAMIFILCGIGTFASCSGRTQGNSGSTVTSTIVREKLDTGNAYVQNCIIDEIGWFDNVSQTESQLKDFWKQTGVQPYIILKAYDSSLTTDSEKEQWSQNYYDENFDAENIFLYVYFAEEDVDNDVGYMTYTNGYQTSSVMDSEAVEIFWNNIDKYWYTNLSTDELFVKAFDDTADTIMYVSTTGKDILKWILIIVAVLLIIVAILLIGGIIVNLVKQKNKRAKEKAEENQRILNTPINDLAKDNLEDKYL
jgi:hypothetical protein